MTNAAELLLAYYGDDFTGSTDALEALSSAGLRALLFLDAPSREELAKFPGLDAIGVAGLTRSLAPDAMETELRTAFAKLRALGPRHVHYKVCSTFDSSPTIGSIGRAIDVGAEVFGTRCVPLLVGSPALGRYCVFGNLFARTGIGTNGEIHRIDRHPVMSRHPSTPMDEGDLRRHLAKQTAKRIGLIDVLNVGAGLEAAKAMLAAIVADGAEIVLFDVLEPEHLATIGALMEANAEGGRTLFSVGSSAVETALVTVGAASCRDFGLAQNGRGVKPLLQEPVLVISGSCSVVTAGQIEWAEKQGFAVIAASLSGSNWSAARNAVEKALAQNRSAVIYTSRGGVDAQPRAARDVGTTLGEIAREVVAKTGVRRVIVAGGDTSSYAARAMGIRAVEMIAPLGPGAPLCRAHAPGSPVDGIEVNFKGGQVGSVDYFGRAAGMKR
jgi:uncharacterized protein YgbK (DUF1537 family)